MSSAAVVIQFASKGVCLRSTWQVLNKIDIELVVCSSMQARQDNCVYQ